MNIRHTLALSLVLCATAAGATPLPVASVEYSADRIMETEAGTFTGRVYVVPGKERAEMNAGGMQSVIILDMNEQVGLMLMPAQRMYQKLDFAQARQQMGSPADDVTIEPAGEDTVEGIATTRYKLLMKDGSAGGFMWFSAEGIPVKMDILQKEGRKKTRATITLRNLEVGAQDPALFRAPDDYAQMPSFGGMGMGMNGGKAGVGSALKKLTGFGGG